MHVDCDSIRQPTTAELDLTDKKLQAIQLNSQCPFAFEFCSLTSFDNLPNVSSLNGLFFSGVNTSNSVCSRDTGGMILIL